MSWDVLTTDFMGPKFYMNSRGDLEMTVLPCKLGSPMSPAPFLSLSVDLTLTARRETKNRKRKFENSSELINSEFSFYNGTPNVIPFIFTAVVPHSPSSNKNC